MHMPHATTSAICLQATSKLASATTIEAVTAAHLQLEALSWDGGYCPYSQSLLALTAHGLLQSQRYAMLCKHLCTTAYMRGCECTPQVLPSRVCNASVHAQAVKVC